MALRRYKAADTYYARAISLNPDIHSVRLNKAENILLWTGDTEKAREVLASLPEGLQIDYEWILLNRTERNYVEALKRLDATSQPIFAGFSWYVPKTLAYASLYHLMNETGPKVAQADSARKLLEAEVRTHPDDARIHAALGLAYAYLGLDAEAVSAAERAVEFLPVSKDASVGPVYMLNLAEVLTVVGEHDQAINYLEDLLAIPSRVSVAKLQVDPIWDGLDGHARFESLLKE